MSDCYPIIIILAMAFSQLIVFAKQFGLCLIRLEHTLVMCKQGGGGQRLEPKVCNKGAGFRPRVFIAPASPKWPLQMRQQLWWQDQPAIKDNGP